MKITAIPANWLTRENFLAAVAVLIFRHVRRIYRQAEHLAAVAYDDSPAAKPEAWWRDTAAMIDRGYRRFCARRGLSPEAI